MNIPSSEFKTLLTFSQNVSSQTKMWITFHVCRRQNVERSCKMHKRLLSADHVKSTKNTHMCEPSLEGSAICIT